MLKLVIVAALVAVTVADSDSDSYSRVVPRARLSQQCAGYCKDSSKFSLQPGATYVYSYEGRTTSGVPGASNETSEISITAKAQIQVSERSCELILQVRDARLSDSERDRLDRHREFERALEQNSLRFSFQDGRIEQLCPSADEPTWVLNIKRGLLSVFQNSMVDFQKDSHLYERDISGTCETTYSVNPMIWSDVKILRWKNLNSCTGRGQQTLGLIGTFPSKAKSIPIIKSEQVCEQTIKVDEGTYLSNAKCEESHVFAPFSNGQSGIKTSAMVSLSLDSIVKSEPFTSDLFVNKRTSLQFEVNTLSQQGDSSINSIWDTLAELATHSQEGVGSQVPQLFDQLVRQLTALDDQQLVKLFDEQQEKRPRQFLLDALPLIGSAGSVKAMYQIYMAQEVTHNELDSWLTALAFHKQPSLDMLQTLNLFLQDGVHPKVLLAVSSVVHSYCQLDPACPVMPEVQAIMTHVESLLGDSCQSSTQEQQEMVVVALKAVGNAGFISSLDTLRKCFSAEYNPMEVRLAAVSATRRFHCSKVHQLPMIELFKSRGQDSELRIAAYLAAMQCPTTATVSSLRDSLYQEDVNQVLSFVWTHLTNLQESTSSWKREVRQMLQDNYLTNKFKTDARKFSRNYEMSFGSDILNTAATVDSNVVFSTKSYLPRSATLNLTLDVFGEPLNVFEVGTRLEGFESVLENLFSPNGFFPDESMEKMLKNMRNNDDGKNEVIKSFSEQFTQGKNEPQGTIFGRVFGNELYLTQFSSLSKLLNINKSNKYNLKYFMDSISSLFDNNNVAYTKSFRFINTEYIIPTVIGLPLRLQVNGTATVGLQLNTKVDLQNIFKTKSGNIEVFVNPSAAIQVDGKMTVDATFTEAGVETKSSLSSNTYLDIKVSIEKGQIVDMFLNVPRDKMEVINVTSAVFVKHRENLVEVEGVGEVSKWDTCSGEHVPTISGMRACSVYVVRNASGLTDAPYFPLTGKFNYILILQKSDSFSAYKLHLKQLVENKNERLSVKFLLEVDTPGSKVDRRLLTDLSFNSKNGDASLELASPLGSFGFTGKFGWTAAEKSLDVKANVNGEDLAAVRLALQADSTARTIRYEPSFLLQTNHDINFNITGKLDIVPGNKYSVDLMAAGFTHKPIALSGDVSGMKGRYSMSLSAKAESVDIKVNGKLVNTPTLTSCKILARYILRHDAIENVDFSMRVQHHKRGGFTKKQLSLNLQMSEFPTFSTKLGWILYNTQKYIDSNVDLMLGKSQWKSQQLYHNSLQQKDKNFELVLSLESPTKNLDYRAELKYKTTDDIVHGHVLAQLNKKNQFITRLDYKHSFPQHSLEFELASPWKRVYLDGKLESPPISNPAWTQMVNGSVVFKWGDITNPQWVAASGEYKAAETLLSAKHMVRARLEGLEWREPLILEVDWIARSESGLILSDSALAMIVEGVTYKASIGYIKDPSQGKHNLKVNLILPENTYSSSFLLINNQEVKNVTVRLDLEKSLYFTSQLWLWESFDLQLFWNYLEDRSQSVLIMYRNSDRSELAVVSMPGHYASLLVDKLGPGLSSMNITALWGENEGSADNAILLSTYWLLDLEQEWLPVVQTSIHLTTPFIGFEQQSLVINLNGTRNFNPDITTREFTVATRWQDQFLNFDFSGNSKNLMSSDNDEGEEHSAYTADISSSLDLVRNVKVKLELQENQLYNVIFLTRNVTLHASYNKWAALTFNSLYSPEQLTVLVALSDNTENKVIFSSELSLVENSVLFKSTLPSNKNIMFKSTYSWPSNFAANLTTPFKGYEESAIQFYFHTDTENVNTRVSGKFGEEFLLVLANLGKSRTGLKGELNVSSSSSVPDLTVMLEHELNKNKLDIFLRESLSILFVKNEEILQSAKAFFSFIDEVSSPSSKSKRLQTLLELPGHCSSSNYTYRSQVKTTGVEVSQSLIYSWNNEQTLATLTYEGMSYIKGSFMRNNTKQVDLILVNGRNGNYKAYIGYSDSYLVQYEYHITDYKNWKGKLLLATPTRSVKVHRHFQAFNNEQNEFVHQFEVFVDKEKIYLDLHAKLDLNTQQLKNATFFVSVPWAPPVTAKYNLLPSTDGTTKHKIQLWLKQDLHYIVEIDTTATDSKYTSSVKVQSPNNHPGGELSYEVDGNHAKGIARLFVNKKYFFSEMEFVKSFGAPSFLFNFNNSDENILHVSCSYDIVNTKKQASLLTRLFEKELNLHGFYFIKENSIKAQATANTPFIDWNKVSAEFDCLLTEKYSAFVFSTKKDTKFMIISGSGNFQSNSLKLSTSIDYWLGEELQKHSIVFEYNKEQESGSVSCIYRKNENITVELNVRCLKDAPDSYLLSYKAHTPFEQLRDSSLEINLTHNNRKHKITGSASINEWMASANGENSFDINGIGHLDLSLSSLKNKIELYVKHAVDEKDAYSLRMSCNDAFIIGSISISNAGGMLQAQYDIKTSVMDMKNLNGLMVIGPTAGSYILESTSNVNNNNYILNYKVNFGNEGNIYSAHHSLWISVPIEQFENITGTLEYKIHSSELKYLNGEISDGRKKNTMYYEVKKSFSVNDERYVSVHIPDAFNMSAQIMFDSLKLSIKTVPSSVTPKFLVNLSFCRKSVPHQIELEINSGVTGSVQFNITANSWRKLAVSGAVNDLNVNVLFVLNERYQSIDFASNIPNWTEVAVLIKEKNIDELNKKYSVSVSKERQDLFYSTMEGYYKESKGDALLTVTMPKLVMDANVNYDFSSNLSISVKYNINGNKQQAEGKVSLSSDSARVDLATPIKGFEDMTLIGSLNRKDKRAGLVFQNSGNILDMQLSATFENEVLVLKGAILYGQDEFIVTLGGQNGTVNEPKTVSAFIHTFKNKQCVFTLSLEGSYDLDTKAGLKLIFSSYYYNQLYFEVFSLKNQLEQALFFNYMNGIDIIYLLNTTIIKDNLNPRIIISSQFGPHINYLDALYDIKSPKKIAMLVLKQNDKAVKISGEAIFAISASNFKFLLNNKGIQYIVENIEIAGEFNFENTLLMKTSFEVNGVNYFSLYLEGHSLYNVEFMSSLTPSDYLNSSYHIYLVYNLDLPDAKMSSHVLLNEDRYNCNGSLTWNEELVKISFQLTTNAGYGFENVVLSAKYHVIENVKYSHLIDFTVDDSKLFLVESDVSYPKQFSVNMVLPDSLFLPTVKELHAGYNFSEENISALFKYMSNSNAKRKLNFDFLLQSDKYKVDLFRSEKTEEGSLQTDTFLFYYNEGDNFSNFQTSMEWENKNIFKASYHKCLPPDFKGTFMTLPRFIFNIKNFQSWNITAAYGGTFQISGVLSPSDISFSANHPSTLYHQRIGLSEFVLNKSIENNSPFFKILYRNTHTVELELKYSDILNNLTYLTNENAGEFLVSTDLSLTKNNKVIYLHKEMKCTVLNQRKVSCLDEKHRIQVTGMSKPVTFFNLLEAMVDDNDSTVSATTQEFLFSWKIEPQGLCSNFSAAFTSSNEPKKPFFVRHETNCVDTIYTALNLFEKDLREVRVTASGNKTRIVLDLKTVNIPILKHINLKTEISPEAHSIKTYLNVTLGEDMMQLEVSRIRMNGSLYLFTTRKELRKFVITTKMSESFDEMSGKLEIEGTKLSTKWRVSALKKEDGSVVCYIDSDKNIEITMNLSNLDDKKEILVKMNRSGKLYEGTFSFHTFFNMTNKSGSAVFSLDGNKYEFNLDYVETSLGLKLTTELKIPSDIYYVDFELEKNNVLKSSFVTLKYKTPFYPVDFAALSLSCSQKLVNIQEYFSTEELGSRRERLQSYDISYTENNVVIFVNTSNFNVDGAKLSITYGDKYGAYFNYLAKKMIVATTFLKNSQSFASLTILELQGFDESRLQNLKGKSVLKIYYKNVALNTINSFVSLQVPFVEKNIFTMFFTTQQVQGLLEGSLHGNWKDKFIQSNFTVKNENFTLKMKMLNNENTMVDSQLLAYRTSNYDNFVGSLELIVDRFLSVEPFSPRVVFKREAKEGSLMQYQVKFDNGVQSQDLAFSGNCSLSLKLPLFSGMHSLTLDSNSSVHADIFLESSSKHYAAVTDLSFHRSQMDTLIKWKRTVKSSQKQHPDYASIKFGGFIKGNSVEFYLNENRFFGSLEHSKIKSSIYASLFNENLKKNLTVFAETKYFPIFLLNISHTVFDSPCSVEIRVDKQPESVESAVTILYNNLKQQAFVNVYLDSNPRYAELMYIDIWQQTHEASVYVEGKNNEVTLRGKVNSPALDENFVILTVGSGNDKLDLNVNDAFIFKAFVDNQSGLLEVLIFGSAYNLKYRCESEVEITIASPIVNGNVVFSGMETTDGSFLQALLDVDSYHLLLEINKSNVFTVNVAKEGVNLLDTMMEIENGKDIFQLQFQCNLQERWNSFSVKHTYRPILVVVSLNSTYLLGSSVEIVFGLNNGDLITGILEMKQDETLFKSYFALSKPNKTLDITVEAPLFSEMDKAKLNGIFNIFDNSEYEIKFSAALSSTDTLLAQTSFHFLINDETFTSGLVVKSKFKSYEDLEILVHIPFVLSKDMKATVKVLLPLFRPCEITIAFCVNKVMVLSALARWQDLFASLSLKYADTPFYANLVDLNLQYLNSKIQIGLWMEPKDPLTDYIYFIDLNEKRIFEISHALILKENHFKSKLIVETLFVGHEKYGVDLELQNLKVGKVVRLLGSAPQAGNDLGVNFSYSYESLLKYTILAQIRVPYNNEIKTAKIYSLHKIHPNLNFSKLNYTLECTGFGIIGWDIEIHGSSPLIWQEKMSGIESRVNLNNNVYSVKARSFVQSDKVQVSFDMETPYDILRKGYLHLTGTKNLVGSEIVLSVNADELVNANITEDVKNSRHIKVLSKWRSFALSYMYDINDKIAVDGYISWDLFKVNNSELGISIRAGRDNQKYESAVELILPSYLIPKLAFKTVFAHSKYEIFSLLQIQYPGLALEGKLAHEISSNLYKSGAQFKWSTGKSVSKNIGVFYVVEQNSDEVKCYFTLQHFALTNDLMLTLYTKNFLYGINMQYSPMAEEQITMEIGYWVVEEGIKERSGLKFVVLHPATNTLIYSVANITTTSEFSEMGFSTSYFANEGSNKIRYVEMYARKSKKTPEMFMGLSSNGNSLRVGGSFWKKDNSLRGVTLEAQVNQKDPLKLELVQNVADLGVEAEVSYGLNRSYRMYAGMPNDNELTARLLHTMYGRPSLDALASLRLNTSRILWGRFEFPPMTQVGQEFYNGVIEEYSDAVLVSTAISTGFSDFLQEDFSEKISLLLNAVSVQTDLLADQTTVEMEMITKNFENIRNTLLQVYEEDHLYLKTCHRQLKKACESMYEHSLFTFHMVIDLMTERLATVLRLTAEIWEVIEPLVAQGRTVIREIVNEGNSSLMKASNLVKNYQSFHCSLVQYTKQALSLAKAQLDMFEQRSGEFLTQAELFMNQLVRTMERTITMQVQRFINYQNTIITGFSMLGDTIEDMLDIIKDGIYRIREVRYALDWVDTTIHTVNSFFTTFPLELYLRDINAFSDKMVQLITSDVEKNFGEYEAYILQAKSILADYCEELNKIPQVHFVKSTVNHVYQKIKWFWNYTNLNEQIKDAVKKYVENMKATLDQLEEQLDQKEGDLRSEYVYNAENNSLTFTQELPFEWQAFSHLPKYDINVDSHPLTIPAQDYSNMVQTMVNYLWQDAKLLPYLLPPFGSDALLSQDNFITFDNSFYQFSSDCNSYLLASDLYHSTFSLLVSYNNESQRDLLLITRSLEILVKNNLEVYINGKLEDLPLKLNNGKHVKIERRVHSLWIESEDGFSLECSSFQDMCRFHVDGWYMGKTAGLFGTYSNEPSDDFVGPDRQPRQNIKTFTDSWLVDTSSCESDEAKVLTGQYSSKSDVSMCELFFASQSSPFFPCFHVVDPQAFYEMCQASTPRDNTCSSVLAYLTKCTSSGVQLWMPDFCSDSQIADSTLISSDHSAYVIIPSKMTVDVVFVVERADCVNNVELNLATLVGSLNTDLKAKGLTMNRFAFISFDSQEAQIQTIKGQIWTEDEKQLTKVLSRLDSSDDSPSLYNSALDLAASLPFRSGASKAVILIHCSSCSHNENYGSVLEKFNHNDITLHILQKENIMSKKGKMVSKAIGLEKNGAYPRKRLSKNVLPNLQLLQQVSVPKDMCSPIMIGTNGTLFNLDVTKKWMRAWSGRVAQGAVPSTLSKECENSIGNDNIPFWMCRRSMQDTKLKTWDQTSLDEYMDTSRGADLYTEYEEVER